MLLRLFFRSRWAVIILSLIIAAMLASAGFFVAAGVEVLLVYALITAIRSHLEDTPLARAYIMGAAVGLAGLLWIWALTAYVPLLLVVLWPLRARTFRVLFSAMFGLATPWWIYLPYYLFKIYQSYGA